MKIQILSDVHVSHYRQPWFDEFIQSIKCGADVLVLAGDVASLKENQYVWTRSILKKFTEVAKTVVFVAGKVHLIATCLLGSVHRLFGHEEEVLNRHFASGDDRGHSLADGNKPMRMPDLKIVDALPNSIGNGLRPDKRGFRQNDGELMVAVAGKMICRPPQRNL